MGSGPGGDGEDIACPRPVALEDKMDLVIDWIRSIVDAGYGWELALGSFVAVGAIFAYIFDITNPHPGPHDGIRVPGSIL